MAQEIKIKRSNTALSPASLKEGELAYGYVANEGKLSIGRPNTDTGTGADVDIIGGTKFVSDVSNATNTNTGDAIVKRDGAGGFSASTVSANLNGNASTATKLAATANIHGVAFDGSANIDLSEQIQDTVGAMFSGNTETDITVTYQDNDGTIDFAVGTLNQDTTGNAATATTLESDITINSLTVNGGESITLNADDIAEAGTPTNKYFTNARADARVEALVNHDNHGGGISVTKDSATGELRFSGASQYDDEDARGALSIHSDSTTNLGSSLDYNNTTGKFTYTAPTSNSVRSAVITSTPTTGGTGYGALSYNSTSGQLSFSAVTQTQIKSSIETTGLNDLTLDNSTTASELIFTGVDNAATRTYTFEGGGNSKRLRIISSSNNQSSNNFTALDFNAYGDYNGTNTIGIGTAAPTSVDQFDYRVEVGPNTKFLGDVLIENSLKGLDQLQLNGSASDTDNSINFNEGLTNKFKIQHNHSDETLSIMQGPNNTAVITIPNSGNTNPNITIARDTDFTGNVSVSGTLTVTGTQTTITSTELAVGDNVITLNDDHDDTTAADEDAGIEIKRGLVTDTTTDRAKAELVFDADQLEWVVITPADADSVTQNAATPIITVANIASKSYVVDGGSFS